MDFVTSVFSLYTKLMDICKICMNVLMSNYSCKTANRFFLLAPELLINFYSSFSNFLNNHLPTIYGQYEILGL